MDKNIKNHEEAIKEIKQAYQFCNTENQEYPYFFIVGAGISASVVKAARGIIDDCKKICGYSALDAEVEKKQDEYSVWFSKAFPHKETRRKYLENLIKDKPIPEDAVKLAQILCSNQVTNLVVTPNFDKFIFEALDILGEKNIKVADLPSAIPKIDINSKSINIVHVHGTYEFYDCCNLGYEIEERAQEDGTFSVKSFLANVLCSRTPIIIGYSGWENDIIINALKERLKMPLKYKMYWFCYSKEDYDNIPECIKYRDIDKQILNEDIIFVIPKIEINKYEGKNINKLNQIENKEGDRENFLNEKEILNKNLHATTVFETIIREFSIPVPEIIKNPIGFLTKYYAQRLEQTLYNKLFENKLKRFQKKEEQQKEEKFIGELMNYIICNNVKKLCEITHRSNIKNKNYSDGTLRDILECLFIIVNQQKEGSRNNDVIENYIGVFDSIETKETRDLLQMYEVKIIKLSLEFIDQKTICREKCNELILETLKFMILNEELINKSTVNNLIRLLKILSIESINKKDTDGLNERLIEYINIIQSRKTTILTSIDQHLKIMITVLGDRGKKDNIETLDSVIKDANTSKDDENLIIALTLKADFIKDENEDEAKILYDKALEILKNQDVDEETYFITLFKRIELENGEEHLLAIQKYDDLINKYDKILSKQKYVARAMYLKAKALEEHSQYSALETYRQITNQYEDRLEMKDIVVNALFKQAIILEEKDSEDSIKIYNKIIEKYKDDDELSSIVCRTMYFKAVLLEDYRMEQAIQQYEELITRYEKVEEVVDIVVRAMLFEAKLLEKIEVNRAEKLYENVINKCQENSEVRYQSYIARIMKELVINNLYTGDKLHCYDSIIKEIEELDEEDKRYIGSILAQFAFNYYQEKKKDYAALCFYIEYKIGQNNGVNLAYLLRKKEVSVAEGYPEFKGILERVINDEETLDKDLAKINYALFLMEENLYLEAETLFKQIVDLDSFDWWLELEDEYEKYVIEYIIYKFYPNKIVKHSIEEVLEKLKIQNIKVKWNLEALA